MHTMHIIKYQIINTYKCDIITYNCITKMIFLAEGFELQDIDFKCKKGIKRSL